MIPQRMIISGFLSYLDPVELDFSGFDLACISGANGAGKSSLLDAITWALFGQARKNDDAVINLHAQQAEVIFEFSYEQNLYRIQRTRPRRKTGLLEFSVWAESGEWRPLTEPTIRATQDRIQSTLRLDYETFINASFFLQGRADQFAQQKPGDRKRILSSILGLEIWEQYREAAAERRRRVESEAKSIQDRLLEIEAELAEEPERRRTLNQIKEMLTQSTTARLAQEKTLEAARRLAAALEEQKRTVSLLENQAAAAAVRLEELVGQISRRQAERDGIAALLAEEPAIRAAHAAWQAARAEVERLDALADRFRLLDGQRTPHQRAVDIERTRLESERQNLMLNQQTYERNVAQLTAITADLEKLRNREAELQAGLDRRAEIQAQMERLTGQISELNAEKNTLKARMTELDKLIKELQSTSGANCPLCGQPLSEEDRLRHLAELQSQGKALGDRYRAIDNSELPDLQQQKRQLEADLTRLEKDSQDLASLGRQVSALQQSQAHLTAQKEQWENVEAPQLRTIILRLESRDYAREAQAALAALDQQIAELGYAETAHQAARQAEQAGRASQERLTEMEKARAALQPLERELVELTAGLPALQAEVQARQVEAQQARAKLEAASRDLPDPDEAESQYFRLQEEENRLQRELGGAQLRVNVLDDLRTRKNQLLANRDELNLQIARLKTLERAFGKDGVPALLIEQALPDIEAHANDILDRISGGSMSVRFETQAPYKDAKREDKKETLDIIISDAAGSREYELFSGGEAFRVNFAIRLALSRVLAQRAGARLQTLVIDEGFGSQDAEGRQRLIEAINLVRPEFARILVITHLEELKDAFPARIEVEKSPRGSSVRVVTA